MPTPFYRPSYLYTQGITWSTARPGTGKSTIAHVLRMSGFFGYPTFAKAKSSLHAPNPFPTTLHSAPVAETRHSRQLAVKLRIPSSAFMSGLRAHLNSKTGRLHLFSCRI